MPEDKLISQIPAGTGHVPEERMSGADEARRGLRAEESMHDIVKRLVEREAWDHPDSAGLAKATLNICRAVRPHLVDIMGTGGFRFMMVRALGMLSTQSKSVQNTLLKVNDEGCLVCQDESALDSTSQAAVITVLSNFFDLLSSYIGSNLVLRLIHQAWPDFSLLPSFSRPKGTNR